MQHAAQGDVFIDRIVCHVTSDSRWVVRVPGVEISVEKIRSVVAIISSSSHVLAVDRLFHAIPLWSGRRAVRLLCDRSGESTSRRPMPMCRSRRRPRWPPA